MDLPSINQLQFSIVTDPVKGLHALPKLLQLGQVVSATVVSTPGQPQVQLQINIGGTLLSASLLNNISDKPLATGDNLNLKVAQLPSLPLAKALNVPIQQLSQSQSSLLLTVPTPLLQNLQAGSVIQLITVDQRPTGQSLLDFNGHLLQGDTSRIIGKGEPIALRINSLSNPVLGQFLNQESTTGPLQKLSQTTKSAQTIAPSLRLLLPPALQSELRIGQYLQSSVISPTKQGLTRLNINGTTVSALTTLPLTQGQQLKLEMIELGKPPVLVLVRPEKIENQISQMMRQLLPQQTGLPEIINSITNLAQTAPSTTGINVNPTVGEQLRFLARQILQQLPQSSSASTATGFKQALQNSGVFFEGNMAAFLNQQQAMPSGDLKANLLRLLAVLQRHAQTSQTQSKPVNTNIESTARIPPPPLRYSQPQAQAKVNTDAGLQNDTQLLVKNMMRQVTGALARIQLQQIASIGGEEESSRVQLAEIPIRHDHDTDVFHVRIEDDRTEKHKSKKDKTWSVTLAFDIGELGPIHVKISLIKNVINTTFWAEHEETKGFIDTQLDVLHNNYVNAGLGIGHMICHHGVPPEPIAPTSEAAFILDVKA